jgi:hypothetical protein
MRLYGAPPSGAHSLAIAVGLDEYRGKMSYGEFWKLAMVRYMRIDRSISNIVLVHLFSPDNRVFLGIQSSHSSTPMIYVHI